jgi:DHA1 family bicyclomycin/chloramphenicol resistance-like MFS transporter
MSSSLIRTRRQNFFLILTLGILNALTPFTIDMYLPSFQQIAGELQVPVAQLALTVSIYFIGFAIGQIIYGPLLDRYGRKKPLVAGLVLYILASLGCASSGSIQALMIFRFVSALGGSASSVAAVAMVRDLFAPQSAAFSPCWQSD